MSGPLPSFNHPRMREQCAPNLQLHNLGLTLDELCKPGFKTHDIGCGPDALLVEHVRENGGDIEGTDPNVENNEYLTKGAVVGIKPMSGHIPREDGHYNLIIAHMNSTLFMCDSHSGYLITGIEEIPEFRSDISTIRQQATYLIMEALRVLDQTSGRFVYYPSIPGFEEDIRPIIEASGFRMTWEKVPGELPIQVKMLELENFSGRVKMDLVRDAYSHRTVIAPR